MASPLTRSTTPNTAIVIGTIGLCLIFLEFNRPGRIIPGATGLLLTLLSAACILRTGVQAWAASLLLASGALLLANVWRRLPFWLLGAATALTIVSLRALCVPSALHTVATPIAVLCGAVLGLLSAVLTRVAYRARRAKALD